MTTSVPRHARSPRSIGPLQLGHPPFPTAPGPTGGPFAGSLRALRRDELGLLVDTAARFGDVARIELGPRVAHVAAHLVRRPEHVHHVLVEARENYPKSFSYELLRRVMGQGLVTSEGDLWLRQRRIIQPIFRHSRVAELAPDMVEAAEACARRWDGLAADGRTVDVAGEMTRLTLDIVGRALFSSDLSGEAAAVGPAVTVVLAEVLERLTSPLGLAALLVPGLPTPSNRRARSAIATLDDVVRRVIATRRAMPEDDRPADLVTMLLAARDEETGAGMPDDQVRDEIMTFLLAGHETTANALAWTWYLLSVHPDVARRVAAELAAVLGTRAPTADDLGSLEYTTAVVKESMRLYPPVALLERDAREEDEIGGFVIPRGSTVVVSPWVCHRNPAVWPAPEAFDPARFLAPDAEHTRYTYLPFGAGPRQCIGMGFALQEAVLVLAVLAPRFRPELLAGHRVLPEASVTVRPRGGLPMTLHRLAV